MERRTFLKGVAQSAVAAATLSPALEASRVLAAPVAMSQTTVTFWQFDTGTPALASWRTAIADFEAHNRDVKINMVIVPWQEQAQKLTTALSTGTPPDVSMMGNDVVAEYANIGALAPLDSYFQAWSKQVGHDITQDFYPGDHLYYRYKGHWYASPISEETRLVYYRKSMLKSAGIDPAKAFQTYQSMRQAALALTKPAKKIFGWGMPGGINYFTLQTFMTFYLAWGARYLNAKGLCGFDTPEFRAALTFYTNLYRKDHVTPPDTPIYDEVKLSSLFQAGKLAMMIDGPWLWTGITDKALLNDIGLAQLPRGPKGRFAFLGGWPLVLWARSGNKDATFRFIQYITDPTKAMTTVCLGNGVLPGRKSLADKAPWNRMPNSIFVSQLNLAYPYQYPYPEIPQMGSLEVDAVQTPVQNVMLGRASVNKATTDLVHHINSVLHP
ncbi:MAG TPA: sugar ABC transporter substrate-binding protein [Chloroflexota bacterium]|nr:sugar ABC transporter substrate-binding protein [Chloroflexota bacterium]